MPGNPVAADRVARFAELVAREDLLEELAQRLAEGESLVEACAAWAVPHGRVLAWLMADRKRYACYERALEVAAHALVAETVPIADGEGFPQNKRIRIETRFRVARHHAPEKYAERVRVESSGTVVLVDAGLVGRAAELLERLSEGRTIEASLDDGEGEI